MDSRSRVHAALRREPVDRVPIWMWFHPVTTQRLAELLEISCACVWEVMGDDIRQTWVGNNHAMEGIVHENEGDTHTDDWGVEWIKVGPFNQIRSHPLVAATADVARAYTYPYGRIDALLTSMEPIAATESSFFVGCDVSPCLFEMVCRLRGMERSLLDLALNPELATQMLADAAAFSVKLAAAACERFSLDWLWTGDDVGGQQGMLMSPEQWRDLVKPHLADIASVASNHGLWLAYHCCGAIRPIIPDLIEMGINVLNPVQCNCPGMDPSELKQEFGRDLAFMGGVDTRELLPYGTAEEVRAGTRELLETMTADGGGYILAASHAVPPETPVVNILAMYAAAGVTREEIFDRAAGLRASAGNERLQ